MKVFPRSMIVFRRVASNTKIGILLIFSIFLGLQEACAERIIRAKILDTVFSIPQSYFNPIAHRNGYDDSLSLLMDIEFSTASGIVLKPQRINRSPYDGLGILIIKPIRKVDDLIVRVFKIRTRFWDSFELCGMIGEIKKFCPNDVNEKYKKSPPPFPAYIVADSLREDAIAEDGFILCKGTVSPDVKNDLCAWHFMFRDIHVKAKFRRYRINYFRDLRRKILFFLEEVSTPL